MSSYQSPSSPIATTPITSLDRWNQRSAPSSDMAMIEQPPTFTTLEAVAPVKNPKFKWSYSLTKTLVDMWVESYQKLHTAQRKLYWEAVVNKFEEKTSYKLKREQLENKVDIFFK